MERSSRRDGSVQALKRELQEERLKSMKVEDMFKELCGELGFEKGIESEAEEPVQVPAVSPDPKRSLSPSQPPTPPTEGNRISSLFSTLAAPNYSERSDNITDGVIKAPFASPHFSVPINSVYPDVREDVFDLPRSVDVIPTPEVQQTPSSISSTSPIITSPGADESVPTSDPPVTSLPMMSTAGGAAHFGTTTTTTTTTTSSDTSTGTRTQLEYHPMQPSSPVPRVSTSIAGGTSNPPSLQGAKRSSIASTSRLSYVSSASAPNLQGRGSAVSSLHAGWNSTQAEVNNNNNNSNSNTIPPRTSLPSHTGRIVTPASQTSDSLRPVVSTNTNTNTTTTPASEEDINKWILEGMAPIKSLSPLLARVFDDVLSNVNFARLPSLKQFTSVEEVRKQEWEEATSELISSQRFLSPFLEGSDILFASQMKAAAMAVLNKNNPPSMRIIITGPKDCGKSTYLHIMSQQLIKNVVAANTFNDLFIVPVDWVVFLGGANIDLGIVYCQLLSHFIDCLAAQVPSIRRWKPQLTTYWKKVVTQTREPTLPSDFAAQFEDVCVCWRACCSSLQASYAKFEYESFISQLMSLPDVFSKCFHFKQTVWLVDNFASLQTHIQSDGKGSAVPSGLTLQAGMMKALRFDHCCCILTSEDDSLVYNLDGKVTAPVQGMVKQSELTKLFPGLPSVVRCSGKEYGVSVFCGCPGYLVPFVKLFEASIPTQKAEDGIQRSVEFYGSDVETLLERLAQISWERGA